MVPDCPLSPLNTLVLFAWICTLGFISVLGGYVETFGVIADPEYFCR